MFTADVGSEKIKSARQAEKELASLSSKPIEFLNRDHVKTVTDQYSEIRFLADQELMDLLEQVRALVSHQDAQIKMAELVKKMARISITKLEEQKFGKTQRAVKKADIKADNQAENIAENNVENKADSKVDNKAENKAGNKSDKKGENKVEKGSDKKVHKNVRSHQETTSSNCLSTSDVESRMKANDQLTIELSNTQSRDLRSGSAKVKRAVYERDGYSCTFQTPHGRRCGSKFLLTLDHIEAWALGGKSDMDNLTVRCAAHNQLRARQDFGEKADQFRLR